MTERCQYAALAVHTSHIACICAGEWLLALWCRDELTDENFEDMEIAAGHFATALYAFDRIAIDAGDTGRRAQVEQIRLDIIDALGDDVACCFDPDAEAILRRQVDLAPHAEPGELRQ